MSSNDRSAGLIIGSILAGIAISVFTSLFFIGLELIVNVVVTIGSVIISVLVIRRVGRYRSIRVTLSVTHTAAYPIITFFLQQTIIDWIENTSEINLS